MEFDRKDINMNKLVASCLEGKYHLYDLRTQHPKRGFASLTEKVGWTLKMFVVPVNFKVRGSRNSVALFFRRTSPQFGWRGTCLRIAMCS